MPAVLARSRVVHRTRERHPIKRSWHGGRARLRHGGDTRGGTSGSRQRAPLPRRGSRAGVTSRLIKAARRFEEASELVPPRQIFVSGSGSRGDVRGARAVSSHVRSAVVDSDEETRGA